MEAVIFDLDDTLNVEETVDRSAVAGALGTVESVSGADPIDLAIACARRHWQRSMCRETCLRLGIPGRDTKDLRNQ